MIETVTHHCSEKCYLCLVSVPIVDNRLRHAVETVEKDYHLRIGVGGELPRESRKVGDEDNHGGGRKLRRRGVRGHMASLLAWAPESAGVTTAGPERDTRNGYLFRCTPEGKRSFRSAF